MVPWFSAIAVILIGVGLSTGVWHVRVLQALPLQLFSASVLYAIIAFIGVLTRSTAFAVVMGYVFFLVIDSVISGMVTLHRTGWSREVPFLDGLLAQAHYLPNLKFLNEVAGRSCLSLAPIDPQPIVVAAIWLLVTLGLAYSKFRRTDF